MAKRYEPITAFILAGGKSTRMGEQKAFKQIAGKSMMDYAVAQGHSVAEDVFIVGDKIMFGAYGRIVSDIYPDCGPLGGIHAALDRTKTEFNIIIALDTPFLTKTFLHFMIAQAQESEKMVTVTQMMNRFNPLGAIYRKGFFHIADAALKAGNLKIDSLFPPSDTLVITEAELALQRFDMRIFENINTPEDFERATTRRPDIDG